MIICVFVRRNGDGFIDREEFGDIIHRTGEPLAEEDIDEMMADSDANKDGRLDFDGEMEALNGEQRGGGGEGSRETRREEERGAERGAERTR